MPTRRSLEHRAQVLGTGAVERDSAAKTGSGAVAPDALVARDPSRTRSAPTGARASGVPTARERDATHPLRVSGA